MSITSCDSVSVEHNLPQNKGESALRLSADDVTEQGRSVAPELEQATMGVGRRKDPRSEAA